MADLEGARNTAHMFVQQYYTTFDSDRASLANVFVDVSIMNFENEQVMGREAIIKKIVGLPFKTVKHVVSTVDGQPTIDSGYLIHVVGQLKTDDDAPHGFSETFYLKRNPSEQFVVLNNVFRLILHNY